VVSFFNGITSFTLSGIFSYILIRPVWISFGFSSSIKNWLKVIGIYSVLTSLPTAIAQFERTLYIALICHNYGERRRTTTILIFYRYKYKTTTRRRAKNEALALRYYHHIFQHGKLEVADEILSYDFVLHNPILYEDLRNGPEGAKRYASAIIGAVPDRKLVHDDILAKGDKVLIRWTNSGTNTGPLFGNPPTGKPYVATGFDLFRISNSKIMEIWQQYNFASWP
jgi:predicted SnoaL-like aldol condensation-catalyzing enzyme